MNTLPLVPAWKKFIHLGLEEDAIAFDWTARSVSSNASTQATLIAKADGIWAADAGLEALSLVSAELGGGIKIKSFVRDGDRVKPKQKICEWTGTPDAIVMFERTFINLASYTCGIATQTHALVERVRRKKMKHPPRIVPTRKTLPGYRDLAIQSTLIGGAYPHRYNLAGGLLLKENHVATAGGVAKAIDRAREASPHLLKIEIEVRNKTELKEAIAAGAEVILLDNFSPSAIRAAIPLKNEHTVFEASGGINLSNIDDYLIEGLDVISIGSITHSVKALDLSLLMNTVK